MSMMEWSRGRWRAVFFDKKKKKERDKQIKKKRIKRMKNIINVTLRLTRNNNNREWLVPSVALQLRFINVDRLIQRIRTD